MKIAPNIPPRPHDRESFVVYTEYLSNIGPLSMEDRGVLFTALLCYAKGEDVPRMPPMVAVTFSFIRQDLDRAYLKRMASRVNGEKGGRPPKTMVGEPTDGLNGLKITQNNPTITQNNLTKPNHNLNVDVDVNGYVDVDVDGDVNGDVGVDGGVSASAITKTPENISVNYVVQMLAQKITAEDLVEIEERTKAELMKDIESGHIHPDDEWVKIYFLARAKADIIMTETGEKDEIIDSCIYDPDFREDLNDDEVDMYADMVYENMTEEAGWYAIRDRLVQMGILRENDTSLVQGLNENCWRLVREKYEKYYCHYGEEFKNREGLVTDDDLWAWEKRHLESMYCLEDSETLEDKLIPLLRCNPWYYGGDGKTVFKNSGDSGGSHSPVAAGKEN